MKIALLSIPGLSPFSPPLSLLSLSNYLRNNDIEVCPMDVSIDFFHYCLNPDLLSKHYPLSKKIAQKLMQKNYSNNSGKHSYYAQLAECMNNLDYILAFLRTVWTMEGFNFERAGDFADAVDIINKAIFFLFLPYRNFTFTLDVKVAPRSWYPNKLSVSKKWDRNMMIFRKTNPLIQYYTSVLISALHSNKPDLIGISFSYSAQAQNGFFMIRSILKHLHVPIVVGGSFFYYLCEIKQDEITSNHPSYSRIAPFLHPFGILGEGEEPLLQLCKRLEAKQPPSNIAGLFYHDKDTIYFHKEAPPLHGKKLPLIELNQFPIGKKYFTPLRIAPLMTSRGCYWNRCAFCDHANVIQNRWREIEPETLLKNLRIYKEKYGIEFVLFCDESMSPRMLKKLCDLKIKTRLDIGFGSMVRLEKRLLSLIEPISRAGCKFLSFGLESGCQRIVNLMEKGFVIENAQKILEKCKRHNIMVELFIMFGFPTEKISEAVETINFLELNHDKIHVFRANPWVLRPNSPVGKNPQLFGIESLIDSQIKSPGPYSHRPEDGISHGLANGLINELKRNKKLTDKMIKSVDEDFKHEEYYIIKYLCN